MKTRRSLLAALSLLVSIAALSRRQAPAQETPGSESEKPALTVKLSGETTSPPAKPASARPLPLSAEDTKKLLDRLPALPTESAPEDDLAGVTEKLGLPKDAKAEDIFPPRPPRVSEDAGKPLEVPRRSPEGDVGPTTHLSVTFSQPMVPMTAAREAAKVVPVQLSPLPEGAWRWVGTRTLVFEPKNRFPMATVYTATIPAGTKSVLGGKLAEAVTWTFSTSPLKADFDKPIFPMRDWLNPILRITFDQKVDGAKIAKSIVLRDEAEGGTVYETRLATTAEVTSAFSAEDGIHPPQEGTWFALRPKAPLPRAHAFVLEVAKGAPSAEGPRTTDEAQTLPFSTYGPLAIVPPPDKLNLMPGSFWVFLSNPLSEETACSLERLVKVEPPLVDSSIRSIDIMNRDRILVSGKPVTGTAYKVTLDPSLTDIYGQKLGPSEPQLFEGKAVPLVRYFPSGRGCPIVLDPASPRGYSFRTENVPALRVKVLAVSPDDFPAFARREVTLENAPGRLVLDKTFKTGEGPTLRTQLDLTPALEDGLGHVLVVAEPLQQLDPSKPERLVDWLQGTSIGLAAYGDQDTLQAWVTALTNGDPLAGVETTLAYPDSPGKAVGRSGANGLVALTLGAAPEQHEKPPQPGFVVARNGKDTAILFLDRGSDAWRRGGTNPLTTWHVVDDRHLYRPGEEVRLKGWVRGIDPRTGELLPASRLAKKLAWKLVDTDSGPVASGECAFYGSGSFDLGTTLPKTMKTGEAQFAFALDGSKPGEDETHEIQVEEFRRPEYEISTTADGPAFLDEGARFTTRARYYTGGALPGAHVQWEVSWSRARFTPPNREDFAFGARSGEDEGDGLFEGETGLDGTHVLRLDFEARDALSPWTVTANATIRDVNRQEWTCGAELLVHPSAVCVGLQGERSYVQKGEPFPLLVLVSDLDGNAVAGRPVSLHVDRVVYEVVGGRWTRKVVPLADASCTSSGESVRVPLTVSDAGNYLVTARTTDQKGRATVTQLPFWVEGQAAFDPTESELVLKPDKKVYAPGETAHLLVRSQLYPAEGLLVIRNLGKARSERFSMKGPSCTLDVPITEADLGAWPRIAVEVAVVGAGPRHPKAEVARKLPTLPVVARASANLKLSTGSRRLGVSVAPRSAVLEPGGETTVDVTVKDAAGSPVPGSEVLLVVVDEAVLALARYPAYRDPIDVFYPSWDFDSGYRRRARHSRDDLDVASLEDLLPGEVLHDDSPLPPLGERRGRAMTGASITFADDKASGPRIIMRTDLTALAAFVPALTTDKAGHAEAKVKLKDSLTRYRIVAVASSGVERFGMSESTVTARKELMVRPSPPRFLNTGDACELPVVVENATGEPRTVDVVARASTLEMQPAGRRVTVPANDRVEVRFPAKSPRPGEAVFQVAVASEKLTDAAETRLPVLEPATALGLAAQGEIDEGARSEALRVPEGTLPGYGGLEVTASSTALEALTDAVIYLVSYPYECSEQLSSRILGIAALKDVLSAFQAKGLPAPEELARAVERDIETLRGRQNEDGGFALWRAGEPSWPYGTIHVVHALLRAKEKGFAVPDDMLERSKKYLEGLEAGLSNPAIPRLPLISYAVYVRKLLGDPDTTRARRLVDEELNDLPLEACGWLLSALTGDADSATQIAALGKRLGNGVAETSGTAHFATVYEQGGYLVLASERRGDAVILDALLENDPKSDLIPKLVKGLLAARTGGRWENTQENAFVLLALDHYFEKFEKATPDFVARAWLGERFAGSHAFKGRSGDKKHLSVPLSRIPGGTTSLVLGKEGTGRLYYRVALRYAPSNLSVEPEEDGFSVTRTYEAVDSPKDVTRDQDGAWRVKAGARVRVRVVLHAAADRYHVALVDPLPAGLEPLNPALSLTGDVPDDPGTAQSYWNDRWFDHQSLRDDRAEAFTSLLESGTHVYTYVARATTPGTFVVPPPRAEEMYSPGTNGHGASDRVVVVAPD